MKIGGMGERVEVKSERRDRGVKGTRKSVGRVLGGCGRGAKEGEESRGEGGRVFPVS